MASKSGQRLLEPEQEQQLARRWSLLRIRFSSDGFWFSTRCAAALRRVFLVATFEASLQASVVQRIQRSNNRITFRGQWDHFSYVSSAAGKTFPNQPVQDCREARSHLRFLWQAAASRRSERRASAQIPEGAGGAMRGLQDKSLNHVRCLSTVSQHVLSALRSLQRCRCFRCSQQSRT